MEKSMENDRLVEAEEIVKQMNSDSEMSKIEEMVRDNRITFSYEDHQYRVRLLNLKEKEELDMLRRKKFTQLMQEKDEKGNFSILLEKDLIKVYKERGIDIDEINETVRKLEAEDLDTQLKLGESISKNEGEEVLKVFKNKIEELRIRKQILSAQKTLLLEFSLENQLLGFVAGTIAYLSSEILEDGVWRKMWNSYDEFINCSDEKIVNQLAQYSLLLQYI